MELPPRRLKKNHEVTIMRNKSSVDVLHQMGFPKNRAEKALAATGDKGVQLASDWLLSHVNDPTLDEKKPRDYVLYLCPVGQLQQDLLDFWQKSYNLCGWNRAHNCFPHVTLCSFFKSEDCHVSNLSHVIKSVAEKVRSDAHLTLEYFSSPNFIGLFVADSCSSVLKQITSDFAEEVKKNGVIVEPHKKQLHISLAYQFPTEVKEKLESQAKSINLNAPVRWDVRLYSRNPEIANAHVRKVMFQHVPQETDELELIDGDCIYLNSADLEANTDGWFQGTSWLTGCTGYFPGNFTEQCAESECWTMHRSIPIVGTELVSVNSLESAASDDVKLSKSVAFGGARPKAKSTNHDSTKSSRPASTAEANKESPKLVRRPVPAVPEATYENQIRLPQSHSLNTISSQNIPSSVSETSSAHSEIPSQQTLVSATSSSSNPKVICSSSSSSVAVSTSSGITRPVSRVIPHTSSVDNLKVIRHRGPRQIYIVRHGERIDFTFGKDWINMSFDSQGNYIRHDLNMPRTLPTRKGGPQDFSKDSPLTVQGHFQARVIGEALQDKEVPVSHIYSSPSLRCVETTTGILDGLGINSEIHLEPGLFEWLGWYQSGMPKFMTVSELREAGFNVTANHNSVWPITKFNMRETTEQYYERCYHVTQEILKRHEAEGGNIMFVAHAGSLDVCTRQLVGQPARKHGTFHEVLHKIPYCSLAVCQEDCVIANKWHIIEPAILPFAHTNNPKYNWKVLIAQIPGE